MAARWVLGCPGFYRSWRNRKNAAIRGSSATANCSGLFFAASLPPRLPRYPIIPDANLDDGRRLTSIEKRHIQLILREVHGNKTEAARQLGINLTTLYHKAQEYGLG